MNPLIYENAQVTLESYNQEGVALMNTMEVLTLLLVVFSALSFIDNHKKK